MAHKTQNVNHSEDRSSSATRTSAAKDTSGTTRQPATSGSGSISSILPRMSDPTPPSKHNSSSPQPMEKPTSSGAQALSKDAAAGTASPYGTRSRNRNGASRPNYAEDKDIDMDLFEMYPGRREDDNGKKPTRQVAASSTAPTQAAAPRASGNGSSRKLPPPSDDNNNNNTKQGTSQNGTKDQHHQSSSSTASPAAGGTPSTNGPAKSKKRKAEAAPAAGAANVSASQTQPAPNVHSATQQKRVGAAASTAATQGGSGAGGSGYAETNMLTFENCKAKPKNGKMVADDGTVLEVNDHVYLVCEPPGEPYYLGRIMEFLHVKNDRTLPVDALRINWYYRPKDIGRKVQDTRLVFATMHSDISPLTSLRGKCQIKHRAEIPDFAEYKRWPDCFWYEKLYDRYIQKNYEVIPTSQIINVPEPVKKVLDERWKYILVEQGRGKELTSAVKTCKRCSGYCASNDSVDCAVCEHTYHMNCVKPPLLKKPSRGFAWSCAACSRAQERKLEARNTPNVGDSTYDAEDEEYPDDEDEECQAAGVHTGRTSRNSPGDEDAHQPATAEQIYHASLWPYRYLGIHCKVEDALDYDDRIFPRASTRLGPRHQATVLPWPGKPVQYVKPLEIITKKSGKKDAKANKELQAAIEAEKIKRENRPKWIQDEPPGWVERGGDDTATLLYKSPEDCGIQMPGEAIDEYMEKAKGMAVSLGLPPRSTNLQDAARDVLFRTKFDAAKALKELAKLPKSEFKEPELTPAEQKKFEEGVAKFGSELHSVMKHVKTLAPATVVRYYYTWKKTERGRQIWGNFSGRKGKKDAKKAEAAANKLADDMANDYDDSAFDTEKARERKKGFICKFCNTKRSRQWRRAPNPSATLVSENSGGRGSNKDKAGQYIQALCRRCAELWRRYAIQWEDLDEVAKKVALTGGRGWRRKVDEELYKELVAADEMMNNTRYNTPEPTATASPAGSAAGQEPPRKKLKTALPDKDADHAAASDSSAPPTSKSKAKMAEKQHPPPPPPPPAPEIPKPRTLPCAICGVLEPLGDQHLSCRECRLAVHRNCYGVSDNRAPGKWTCDMCMNDKNPQVAIHYKCVLCPVEHTEHDFVEPPKISHKKKTEKERERERMEREKAHKDAEYFRKKQEEMNRPVNPREPLKRTADNNWVHVTCAVMTPEVKFGNAKALSPSEGIPSIPRARYAETCKVCKTEGGACVACHQCRASMHVECARQAGYVLGFEITPVKGSRRDQVNVVTINGETGVMSAGIWCKEHASGKTNVHRMHEVVDESGTNALQLYVQNFKQADLTLTGCARKANQITVASKMSSTTASAPASQPNRRASTATMVNGHHGANGVNGINGVNGVNGVNGDHHRDQSPSSVAQPGGKVCWTCGVDGSPKWHVLDQAQELELMNGYFGNIGAEAQKFVEQRRFQCHKCKKTKRQPRPHPPPREPTPTPPPIPPPEPVRQLSQGPAVVSSAPVVPLDPRQPSRGHFGWPAGIPGGPSPMAAPVPLAAPGSISGPVQAAQHAQALQAPMQAPGPIAPPLASPGLQGHPVGPGGPAAPPAGPVAPVMVDLTHSPVAAHVAPPHHSSVAPPPLPPSMSARGPPPVQPPPYAPPPPRPYDWHRPASVHGPPPPAHSSREMNGGPSPPPLNPTPLYGAPNHLRPPPLSGMAHPSSHAAPLHPPSQNGHMAQPPFVNGMPPSPRRASGPPPPPQNGGPYAPSHHGPGPNDMRQHHHAPPMQEPNYLRQWGPPHHPPPPPHPHPHPSHHGSPPLPRESLARRGEPSIPPPPPPQRDNRPASSTSANASISPSLRNLLS